MDRKAKRLASLNIENEKVKGLLENLDDQILLHKIENLNLSINTEHSEEGMDQEEDISKFRQLIHASDLTGQFAGEDRLSEVPSILAELEAPGCSFK